MRLATFSRSLMATAIRLATAARSLFLPRRAAALARATDLVAHSKSPASIASRARVRHSVANDDNTHFMVYYAGRYLDNHAGREK